MGEAWTGGPQLDVRPSLDPRNALWPIRPLLGAAAPRSYTWRLTERLHQGSEGACVGFAWAHELAARPLVVPSAAADALAFYRYAQTVDEWAGEAYSGTSVLAGAKAVAALRPGRLAEYRWAASAEDVALAVGHRGPVVLGVPWLEGMSRPDSAGFIRAQGAELGGHAIVCNGYRRSDRSLLLTNSWGPGWGDGGTCRLLLDDLAVLLARWGEACIPVRR